MVPHAHIRLHAGVFSRVLRSLFRFPRPPFSSSPVPTVLSIRCPDAGPFHRTAPSPAHPYRHPLRHRRCRCEQQPTRRTCFLRRGEALSHRPSPASSQSPSTLTGGVVALALYCFLYVSICAVDSVPEVCGATSIARIRRLFRTITTNVTCPSS